MTTFSLAHDDDARGPYAWMTTGITRGTDAKRWVLLCAVTEVYFNSKPPYPREVAKELYYAWAKGPEHPAALAYVEWWMQENEATLPPPMRDEKSAALAKVYDLLIERRRKRRAREAAEAAQQEQARDDETAS